ncbi:putative SNARE associated golgi family protein [Helianthus anomalus]
MTYKENNDVVTLIKIAIEEPRDDYVALTETEELTGGNGGGCYGGCGGFWWWLKLLVVIIFVGFCGVCFFLWIGPFLMNKGIIPVLNWETETFSKPVLAVLVFGSVALFPTVFIPSTPSMWVAGMSFGYGFGFLLIIGGVTIGASLPYFIGSLFYHKIQGWLERYPKKASFLKLAGEGNWFNQFRAVALLRISPFPYMVYNYIAVATDVKFGPYLLGTLLGMVPEIFVAIYTGIMIRTLADASDDQQTLSVPQIICTVFGFVLTIATTVVVTVYSKRRLSDLQKDEEQLLLQ